MTFLWEQDMAKSLYEFENGCMHSDALRRADGDLTFLTF